MAFLCRRGCGTGHTTGRAGPHDPRKPKVDHLDEYSEFGPWHPAPWAGSGSRVAWAPVPFESAGSGSRVAWAEAGERSDQTAAAGRRLPPSASRVPPTDSVLQAASLSEIHPSTAFRL